MTYPIWQLTRQDMNHMKSGSKNNLALHSLLIARSMDIEFHVDHFDLDQWTIKGGGTPLRPYILATQHYTWFKKLRVLTRYPVFFTDQLFTDRTQPVTWQTLKELNGLSTKGRQALWFQQLISAVLNPELKAGSDAIQTHCPPDPLNATSLVSPDLQPFRSNSYVWDFMQLCSRKHSSKPFVVFKTWDTNDRNVGARLTYKIGKVTRWDDKDRITILIYQLSGDSSSDWHSALTSKSYIRWIPITETRMLNIRIQDSQPQIHNDWISLFTHWNDALTPTIRLASKLG